MAKNGMPHQTLATIGPHMALRGSERMGDGVDIKPGAASQCGIGPMTGLNIQAQLRPERKLGTAQGRKTSAWAMARPRKGRFKSSARIMPKKNCSTTEAPAQN